MVQNIKQNFIVIFKYVGPTEYNYKLRHKLIVTTNNSYTTVPEITH